MAITYKKFYEIWLYLLDLKCKQTNEGWNNRSHKHFSIMLINNKKMNIISCYLCIFYYIVYEKHIRF